MMVSARMNPCPYEQQIPRRRLLGITVERRIVAGKSDDRGEGR
jgi:hypothetical protein